MAEGLLIRAAEESDAASLSFLLSELGHPVDEAGAADRLRALSAAGPLFGAFVAVAGGEVVGVVTAFGTPVLHRLRPVGRISVLVVRSTHAGRGAGSALLRHAEAFLSALGCGRVELTSADHRVAAHEFYRHRGYDRQGLRFTRALQGS